MQFKICQQSQSPKEPPFFFLIMPPAMWDDKDSKYLKGTHFQHMVVYSIFMFLQKLLRKVDVFIAFLALVCKE